MSPEEIEKFNIELKALLIRYDATLTIGHQIQVNKVQKAETIIPEVIKPDNVLPQED